MRLRLSFVPRLRFLVPDTLTCALRREDPLSICGPADGYEPEALAFLMEACGLEPFTACSDEQSGEVLNRDEVKAFLRAPPPAPEVTWKDSRNQADRRIISTVLKSVFAHMFGTSFIATQDWSPALLASAQRSAGTRCAAQAQSYMPSRQQHHLRRVVAQSWRAALKRLILALLLLWGLELDHEKRERRRRRRSFAAAPGTEVHREEGGHHTGRSVPRSVRSTAWRGDERRRHTTTTTTSSASSRAAHTTHTTHRQSLQPRPPPLAA